MPNIPPDLRNVAWRHTKKSIRSIGVVSCINWERTIATWERHCVQLWAQRVALVQPHAVKIDGQQQTIHNLTCSIGQRPNPEVNMHQLNEQDWLLWVYGHLWDKIKTGDWSTPYLEANNYLSMDSNPFFSHLEASKLIWKYCRETADAKKDSKMEAQTFCNVPIRFQKYNHQEGFLIFWHLLFWHFYFQI